MAQFNFKDWVNKSPGALGDCYVQTRGGGLPNRDSNHPKILCDYFGGPVVHVVYTYGSNFISHTRLLPGDLQCVGFYNSTGIYGAPSSPVSATLIVNGSELIAHFCNGSGSAQYIRHYYSPGPEVTPSNVYQSGKTSTTTLLNTCVPTYPAGDKINRSLCFADMGAGYGYFSGWTVSSGGTFNGYYTNGLYDGKIRQKWAPVATTNNVNNFPRYNFTPSDSPSSIDPKLFFGALFDRESTGKVDEAISCQIPHSNKIAIAHWVSKVGGVSTFKVYIISLTPHSFTGVDPCDQKVSYFWSLDEELDITLNCSTTTQAIRFSLIALKAGWLLAPGLIYSASSTVTQEFAAISYKGDVLKWTYGYAPGSWDFNNLENFAGLFLSPDNYLMYMNSNVSGAYIGVSDEKFMDPFEFVYSPLIGPTIPVNGFDITTEWSN